MEDDKKIITANEFRLTNLNGKIRASLTATENGADFIFSDDEGNPQLKITTGGNGLSALKMYDNSGQEKIGISVDEKGTHVHLAGKGKQESYLFLKNSGATGLILTDIKGDRRLEAKVGPGSEPEICIYPANGEPKKL